MEIANWKSGDIRKKGQGSDGRRESDGYLHNEYEPIETAPL
jgi:hypothetical protein